LREPTPTASGGAISGDRRESELAEAWFAGLTDLSPITMQAYRDRLDRQFLPRLGGIRLRELPRGLLDRHLRATVEDPLGLGTSG
jgi:hypothetical protein